MSCWCTRRRRTFGLRQLGGAVSEEWRAPRADKAPPGRRTPVRFVGVAVVWWLMLGLAVGQEPIKISGVVSDSNGAAIADASVEFETEGTTVRTTTDSAGNFTVLSARPYGTLTISSRGFKAVKLEVSSASDALRIRLHPADVVERILVNSYDQRVPVTAASHFTLGQREIDSAGAVTLDDLLRQVPGFSLFRRSGSLFANPTSQGVSLRGVGANGASRALVLLDGVPLNSPFGGWVYWNRIPKLDIESVIVSNGGKSDYYGNAALGGVVNIGSKTRSPTNLELESSIGNQVTAATSFVGGKLFGDWAVVAAGQALHTDGYVIVPQDQRGSVDTPAGTGDLAGSATISNISHGYSFLRLSSFGESRRNGTPVQVNDTRISAIDFGFDSPQTRAGEFFLRAYGSSEHFNQNFSAVAPDRNSESLTNRQRNPSQQIGFVFQWRPAITGQDISAGVEGRDVRGHSAETTFNNSRITAFLDAGGRQRSIGIFGSDTVHAARWEFSFGGRVDHWRNSRGFSNRIPVTGAASLNDFPNVSETAFSPRLAVTRSLGQSVEIRAAAYRAFRAPTLNELYRNFRVGNVVTNANAGLSAERLTGGEVGIGFSRFGDRLFVRSNLYWSKISDSIANVTLSTTPALITRQRQNLGAIRARGIELAAISKLDKRWEIAAEYLLADSTVLRFPANPALEGLLVPQVPRHQVNFQVTYAATQWFVSTQGRFTSKQFDDDQNTLPLDGFFTLDAEASRTVSEKVRVFVAVQNLTGSRYQISSTAVLTVGPPVLIRGGVRVRLK
jgi:outer membrane receptor protein involved in Fe transport